MNKTLLLERLKDMQADLSVRQVRVEEAATPDTLQDVVAELDDAMRFLLREVRHAARKAVR